MMGAATDLLKKDGSLIWRMACKNAAVKSLSASVRKSYKTLVESLTNWRLMAAISAFTGKRSLSMMVINNTMTREKKCFSPWLARYCRI
jgi:hypothetical protein